ncbi:MAG TPA: trypsin-like serine protease [Candidatus Acidoferrum sp.]|nr:trypsin-like serine protease [Candidatus Acidoferrum sp.]
MKLFARIVFSLFVALMPSLPAFALINPVATQLSTPDWMAVIYVTAANGSDHNLFCKGALIASDWVMTSAACLYDPYKAMDTAADPSNPDYAVVIGQSKEYIAVTQFVQSDDFTIGLMHLAKPVSVTPLKVSTKSAAALLKTNVYILGTQSSPAIGNSYFNAGVVPRVDCNLDGTLFYVGFNGADAAACYILTKPTTGTSMFRTDAVVVDPQAVGSPNSPIDVSEPFVLDGSRFYLDFRAGNSYPCHEDLGAPVLAGNSDGSVEMVGIVGGVGTAAGMPMCNGSLVNQFYTASNYAAYVNKTIAKAQFSALCPGAPSLQVQYLSGYRVRLYWSAVANASGYRIHYTTAVGYYKIATVDMGTKTEVTVSVNPGVDYTVGLSAYSASCNSPASTPQTVSY